MALPTADEFFGAPKAPSLPSADEFFGGGKPTADEFFGSQEGVLPHLSRRWTEGNRGVARADAGAQLAAVENYDVQGAARDFARPRLPGDAEPASSAFLNEQTGNRQKFMEQKALLGGDVNPQQARQSSALDAFETARNAKANVLMTEINANSPQPTEAGQVGPVTQFVGDVVGNIPRLGRTMAAGVASAPLGGIAAPAYMAEQIFGETYAGYRQKGKDPERAAIAAGINALAQAPLEYVPTKKLLDLLGSKGGKLAGIAKVMGAEGLTEYAQAYPEAFADVYVDNPDASAGQLLSLFLAKVKTGEFQKGAAYEGAVGAVTGGGLAGVAAGVQKAAGGKQPQPQAPTGAESLHAVGDSQDADLARRIVGPESGGNPNAQNPNSSARGLGQFTQATRDAMLARHGVDAYSTDPAEQMRALEILTRENRDALTKGLGRAPTDGEIYTAHFLGSGGALQFLGALQASPDDAAVNHVSPAAARANQSVFYNKDGSAKTVAEVAASLSGKVGQGDVFDTVAQQERPEGAFGPVRPELAALREDMQSRPGEVEQIQPADVDPWEIKTVQDAASQAAGVQLPRARENELRSLREDIQAREVRARVVEEQGNTLPVREAMRLQETPALPQGQGFEAVGKPYTPKDAPAPDSRAWMREQQQMAKNETADPITSFVWGRISKAGVDPRTGRALLAKFGPGIFAPKGKGAPLDVLTEELNSTGRPVPENFGGDPLVSYLLDRGTSAKLARKKFMESAKAEASRMDNEMMRMARESRQAGRIEFRPGASFGSNVRGPVGGASSIREAYNPETMMGPEDVPFSASPRRGVTSLSTRTVASATAPYERAMPGAAPTRILQSGEELPAHIREQVRNRGYSLGQIRGVHDPRTSTVYLVADNLIDGAEAGRIWLHEQLAHHGLWELFGRSGKFMDVLESVRKSYGYETTRQAEEHIAEIAEQLDAGKALSPKDGFHWRKLVDAVRSWLAEHGISVTRANLEAMLRRSARNLAKGADAQGQGMQEAAAFSQEREGMFAASSQTETPEFKRWSEGAPAVNANGWSFTTGKPVVVLNAFHGAPDARDLKSQDARFKSQKEIIGLGRETHAHWFAAARSTANTYADDHRAFDYQNAEPGVVEAYLKFTNPLVVEGGNQSWRDAQKKGRTTDLIEDAQAAGHDGVIILAVKDDYNTSPRTRATNTFVVFSPNQIKSVDNQGTFDPEDPRIRFSIRDASLSDYQKDRLSTGAKLKDIDLKRMFGIARMLFTDHTAAPSDLAVQAGGKNVAREFDKQSRRRAGVQGIVHDMVNENGSGVSTYGVQGGEMEIIPGSKTMMQVLAPLMKNFQRYVDFNSYMVARREVALVERNKKTLAELKKVNGDLASVSKDVRSETDPVRRAKLVRVEKGLRQEATDLRARVVSNLDETKATIELQRLESVYGVQGVRQFEAMHKDMVKWLDQAVLKPRLDAGLLSQEAYDSITKSPEHEVYAAFQREIERDGVVTVGGTGGPKRIKGSERKIIAPIESALAAVVRTVREVEQAKANQMLVDLRNVNPEIAEVITPARQPGRGTITTYQNGVAKHWSVPWEVAAGMNGLSPEAARIIRYVENVTLLRPAAQLMRMGTTVFSLAFSIRNIVRDQVHATAMSKHGYNPTKFVGGLVEYLKDATGKDSPAMREWRRSGGETGMYTAMEQSQVELTVKDLLGFERRTVGGQAVRYATSPFKAIRWIGEAGEKATRVALFENARKKGASASDAMLESRDTTVDFSRVGLAGQVINQIIPFWNANVQGLSKMGRTIKERPGRFALNVLLGITAPSILEWAAYHDEEWWKNLQAWEKDMFWHVKAGDAIIRIPKPFEVGVLFGSLPVRVLEWWETNDASGMWKVAKAIKDGMTPPLSNPLVTPLLENATNHSFMSDRPLESKSMENLQPWMRYNSTTSEFSKEVGKLFDISPIKMDNWIRGQMGTVGRDVSKALDAPINAMRGKDSPPSPSKPWYEQTPGVSGFISREPIGSRSEAVADFYTNLERTGQAASTGKALREAGNIEDAARIESKDAFFAPAFKKASADIADMRKEIAAVNESMAMTPDAKRARIDEIERSMTRRAGELNAAYNRNEPTPEALFLGTKAQVNAARDAYNEAQKAGRKDEAARIARESDMARLLPMVKGASSRLSQIEAARNKLNDNPKLDAATRKRWLDKLDEQEAAVMNAFQKMKGARRG